jgi:hypothetical protein
MKLTHKKNPHEIAQFKDVEPAPLFGDLRCFAPCEGETFTCTLADGHTGPHVAHGFFKKVIAVWDDEDSPTLTPKKLAFAFMQLSVAEEVIEQDLNDIAELSDSLDESLSRAEVMDVMAELLLMKACIALATLSVQSGREAMDEYMLLWKEHCSQMELPKSLQTLITDRMPTYAQVIRDKSEALPMGFGMVFAREVSRDDDLDFAMFGSIQYALYSRMFEGAAEAA